MLPEEHGDSDLDDEGTGDSPTPNEIDFDWVFKEKSLFGFCENVADFLPEWPKIQFEAIFSFKIRVHESLQKDEIMIAQIMTSSSGPSLK